VFLDVVVDGVAVGVDVVCEFIFCQRDDVWCVLELLEVGFEKFVLVWEGVDVGVV
jgi:hypothetical protein